MAKVNDILEIWKGSQNICTRLKESHTKHKHITAVEYISDTEEILNTSCSPSEHGGGVAEFKLSQWFPFKPAWSTNDLPGGQTQPLTLCWISTIHRHQVMSNDVTASERISDTDY